MTGIAASFVFDASGEAGRAAATASTGAILDRLIGPSDGPPAIWSAPKIALGQAWWATTPEDLARGGGIAELGSLRLVADARIDNRDELIDALRVPRTTPDPELLLACWERWGETTLLRVAGDYAFAIWDTRTEVLVLAHDPMGIRPLYFTVRGGAVLASSEHHALGAGPWGISFELEPLQAALLMLDRYSDSGPSLFAGVEIVPPGGIVRVERGRVTRRRVWNPDPFAAPPARDAEGCAEHLRELLGKAVRARLRRIGGLGVLISGGLDSSTSACLAARAEPERASAMQLLHVAFPGLGFDEAPYFDSVVSATGARPVSIDPRPHVEVTAPITRNTPPGEMYDVTSAMMFPLLETLDRRDKTVVLTGAGGDDLLTESMCELGDNLRAGRLRAAYASALRGGQDAGSLPRFLASELSQLAIGGRARAAVRRLRPPRWAWPDWLTDRGMRLVDAWHREQMERVAAVEAPTETLRRLAFRFRGGTDLHFYTARTDYFGRRYAIDQRHPFYDRRVVEALFSLPHELRFDGLLSKVILRRAMAGILPEKVRARSDAADFNPYTIERMQGPHRQAHLDLLSDNAVEAIGIVEHGRIRGMIDDAPTSFRTVTRALAIETALRTIRAPRASKQKD